MNIHHGIVKKAAKAGVILSIEDDAIVALHTQTNFRVAITIEDVDLEGDSEDQTALNSLAQDALVAVTDIVAFNTDEANGGWKIEQDEDGTFFATDPNGELLGDAFNTIADAVEAVNEAKLEDGPEDEDDEGPHSVVPEGFKALYREIGINGQDNGDFLAAAMSEFCRTTEGIDVFRVEKLLSRNGIDREPIAGNRGWEGRYRMTARNMLARRIADDGTLYVPVSLVSGEDPKEQALPVPPSFRDRWASKPKKSRAKAKPEAEAAPVEAPKAKRTRKPKVEA